jgi:protein-disulfide isomerase
MVLPVIEKSMHDVCFYGGEMRASVQKLKVVDTPCEHPDIDDGICTHCGVALAELWPLPADQKVNRLVAYLDMILERRRKKYENQKSAQESH